MVLCCNKQAVGTEGGGIHCAWEGLTEELMSELTLGRRAYQAGLGDMGLHQAA